MKLIILIFLIICLLAVYIFARYQGDKPDLITIKSNDEWFEIGDVISIDRFDQKYLVTRIHRDGTIDIKPI